MYKMPLRTLFLRTFLLLGTLVGPGLSSQTTIQVAVSPASATLAPGATVSFTATVTGTTSTRVAWNVDDVLYGSTAVGTITGTGNTVVYTAPATSGTHTVTAISDALNTKSASAAVTVQAAGGIAVAVTPATSTLTPGGTVSFTATVTGTTSTRVAWNVDGVLYGSTTVGTITGTGNTVVYTAPATAGTHTVTAVSDALNTQKSSAVVTVQAPASPVAVAVAHSGPGYINFSGSVLFTATVTGSTNTAVTWSVDGIAGGDATVGTIKGTGNRVLYLAPSASGTHTVTATSAADPTKSAATPLVAQATAFNVANTALIVNVKDAPYNAKGDGVTDDTHAIQDAITHVAGTGGTVLIPDGTYMINVTNLNGQDGLMLSSNMTLTMTSGATLQAMTNDLETYFVIYIWSAENVNVLGGNIIGDRATHIVNPNSPGEWGTGIGIGGTSSNITIQGVTITQSWGDGIYFSENPTNVTICGVVCTDNRRQGMTVTGASGLVVRDSVFSNNTGTEPENGIDFEPNSGASVLNMETFNNTISGNAGGGIQCGPATANMAVDFVTGCIICYNTLNGNNVRGIEMGSCNGNTIADNVITNTTGSGIMVMFIASNILITGNTVTGSTVDGIFLSLCQGTLCTGNTANDNGSYGIYAQTTSGATVTGNTEIGNVLTQ